MSKLFGQVGRVDNRSTCPNLFLSILGYQVGRVHPIWTYVQNFVVFFFESVPQTILENFPSLSLTTILDYLRQLSQAILDNYPLLFQTTILNYIRQLSLTILDNYPRLSQTTILYYPTWVFSGCFKAVLQTFLGILQVF